MMETNGLEIKLNGQPLCRAGFNAERYHLTCMMTVVMRAGEDAEKVEIIVGGSEGSTLKLVNWVEQPLKEGDQITIELISGNYDPPQSSIDTHLDLSQAASWLNKSAKEILDSGAPPAVDESSSV